MALIIYATKEEIPDDLTGEATEIKEEGDNKGKWSVNVVPRKKLEEFRDNNVANSQKLQELEGKFKAVLDKIGAKAEDFDVEQFGELFGQLSETSRKVADGKLKESGDIDKVVEERTQNMRQKFDDEMRGKQSELAKMKSQLDEAVGNFKRTFIDRAVSAAITDTDLGVEPSALMDIMNRAYSVFTVEQDNSLTPKKNGQTLWSDDGSTPMSVKEWINSALRKEAPHYFKKSNGGGAQGGDGNKGFGGLSEEEFDKLPARAQLEIANRATTGGKR